jgi:hypothetical protein
VILTGVAVVLSSPARGSEESALDSTRVDTQRTTSVGDQTEVAVTIYNNNLALVKDRRKVTLSSGEIQLQFEDVAKKIKPETVSMRSVSHPGALRIIEQNYEYDLISYDKLMEKYVGQDIKLINFSDSVGFTEKKARLIGFNDRRPIYQVDEQIFLHHPGSVVLPKVPDNLIAKPTLIWLLDNRATDQEIEVTYLTDGISWRSDYVVVYDEKMGRMDLDAWITLNNQSGAAYNGAKLKLVAGDVHRVREMRRRGMQMEAMALQAAAPRVQEESFAEYHLYTVPRKTTIKENQSKQINLFSSSEIKVDKLYEFRGQRQFYSDRHKSLSTEKVASLLRFENEEANSLGIPLPAGIVRVYQRDAEGALQFSGEDRVDHTPKDEPIRLQLGNAFDVVGERVQQDFRRVAPKTLESSFRITLRNHKDTDIKVDVVEPFFGDWEILQATHEHAKRDARTAVFTLPVKADGEVVLEYRVQIRTG